MDTTIHLTDSMKHVLGILNEAVADKQRAVNGYAVQCAEGLGVNLTEYALDVRIPAFVPRAQARPA